MFIYSKIYVNIENDKQADSFLNIGMAHVKLGNNETSIEFLEKALTIYRKTYKTENNFRIAECLTSFGLAEFNLRKYPWEAATWKKSIEKVSNIM